MDWMFDGSITIVTSQIEIKENHKSYFKYLYAYKLGVLKEHEKI